MSPSAQKWLKSQCTGLGKAVLELHTKVNTKLSLPKYGSVSENTSRIGSQWHNDAGTSAPYVVWEMSLLQCSICSQCHSAQNVVGDIICHSALYVV